MGNPPVKLSGLGIPRWRILLSYLADQYIEALPSDVSGTVSLLLCRGRLQLCSENAIYSYDDLYDNFGDALQKFPINFPGKAEVLILGFGLGSVALLLEKQYPQQHFSFTGIELDESVIELASRYTLPRLRSSVTLHFAEAAGFIHQATTSRFHFIAVDVFVDDQIPEALQTREFIQSCYDLLEPEGMMMMNWLGQFPEDEQKAGRFFENIVRPVCPEAISLKTSGNVMIIMPRGDYQHL